MNYNMFAWICILISIPCALANPDFYYAKDSIIELSIPCINNGSACSALSTCNISVWYPNTTIMISNQEMTYNVGYHNYTLPATDTIGVYQAVVFCTDAGISGSSQFNLEINNFGRNDELSGQLLMIAILPLLVIMIVALVIAFKTDSDNSRFTMGPEGDYILELKYGLYLKIFMYMLAYIMLWVISYLCWQISRLVISFTAFGEILKLIFWLITIAFVPLISIITILGLVKLITDSELLRLSKRGLRPR